MKHIIKGSKNMAREEDRCFVAVELTTEACFKDSLSSVREPGTSLFWNHRKRRLREILIGA